MSITVRKSGYEDKAWILETLIREWHGPVIERVDEYIDADKLPALVAEIDGDRVGLATVMEQSDHVEIVTLNSFRERNGIGTALIKSTEAMATGLNKPEVRIFTYNGNLNALGFYQRRGYRLWTIHHDTITRARETRKPDIPLLDENGIVIADEIELRRTL